MWRYILKRILLLIPVLLGVSFVIFFIMELTPGDPAELVAGVYATPEQIQEMRVKLELDKPAIVRYFNYVIRLFQGDLGTSYYSTDTVIDLFMVRFPATLALSLSALLFAIIIAIPIGILSAVKQNSIFDNFGMALSLIGVSMPSFWLGLLLLIWFSHNLKIFPAGYDGTWKCFILPVFAGGFSMSASITRQTRSAILDVSRQDFLRTARAKGVPERQVTLRHELGNAWIPIITQIGMMLGITLSGSAVIEAVYSWPGVGYMMVEAIGRRDTNLACGCVILTATMYTLVLLLVDLIYAAVDPRIRSAYARKSKRRVKA